MYRSLFEDWEMVLAAGMILCCLVSGCSQAAGYEPDTNEAAALVAAQIAFHEPQHVDNSKPQTKCDECEGKGVVESGDKLSWVKCSCGDNCKCEKPKPRQDNRLVVTVYYAKDFYCGPCEELKANLNKIPEVRFVEHTGEDPWWIEAYPTLHWTGDDGEEYQYASGDIDAVRIKLMQRNPSLFPVQETAQQTQTYYYENYQPTRRGRRFFYSGCSSGRCR